MPLYDFQCADCSHAFEAQRPIARRGDAECPKCGSRRVKRPIRAVHTPVRGSCTPRAAAPAGG